MSASSSCMSSTAAVDTEAEERISEYCESDYFNESIDFYKLFSSQNSTHESHPNSAQPCAPFDLNLFGPNIQDTSNLRSNKDLHATSISTTEDQELYQFAYIGAQAAQAQNFETQQREEQAGDEERLLSEANYSEEQTRMEDQACISFWKQFEETPTPSIPVTLTPLSPCHPAVTSNSTMSSGYPADTLSIYQEHIDPLPTIRATEYEQLVWATELFGSTNAHTEIPQVEEEREAQDTVWTAEDEDWWISLFGKMALQPEVPTAPLPQLAPYKPSVISIPVTAPLESLEVQRSLLLMRKPPVASSSFSAGNQRTQSTFGALDVSPSSSSESSSSEDDSYSSDTIAVPTAPFTIVRPSPSSTPNKDHKPVSPPSTRPRKIHPREHKPFSAKRMVVDVQKVPASWSVSPRQSTYSPDRHVLRQVQGMDGEMLTRKVQLVGQDLKLKDLEASSPERQHTRSPVRLILDESMHGTDGETSTTENKLKRKVRSAGQEDGKGKERESLNECASGEKKVRFRY